LHYLGILHTVN